MCSKVLKTSCEEHERDAHYRQTTFINVGLLEGECKCFASVHLLHSGTCDRTEISNMLEMRTDF